MKFAWVSDSHIGYTQYGLSRRRLDFERALENAIETALRMGVKLIVHTGDLLNSNRPTSDAIECLCRIHRMLIANHARMAVISGNHDQADPPWPTLLEPDENQFGIIVQDHQVFSSEGVTFFGIPSVALEQFRQTEWPEAHVLMCHLLVQEFIGFAGINALPIRELPGDKFSAILIGDVHLHSIINHPEHPKCVVGYTGSTELCSESEPDGKLWTLVEMEGPTVVQMTPVPIKTRPVFRYILKNEKDIDTTITEIKTRREKHMAATGDDREPIVFIDYPSDLTGAMERFRAALNPDRWVLRFRARLRPLSPHGMPLPMVERELTVDEILRSNLAMRHDLLSVAEKLIQPDLDPNTVIDEFIEKRLQAIAPAAGPADGGASELPGNLRG